MLGAPFIRIYEQDGWRGGSGTGSAPVANIDYIATLSRFMALNDVRSVVDFGCGDWQFSRLVDWSKVDYLGVDVVPRVIEQNRERHAAPNIRFELFESLDQLPRADLLICKDVLQHLPNGLVRHYVEDFRHRFRWLLVTNDDHPTGRLNQDIAPGGWRPLRLDQPPFGFPCTALSSWTVISATPTVRKRLELIQGTGAQPAAPRPAEAPRAEADPIPRRVMQTWKTRGELPARFQAWSDTVRTTNPDFEHVLTDDADNRVFMGRHFPWFMPRYDAYPREIQRVEACRYFWLFMQGGFHLHLDVECLKPLDSQLQAGDVVLGRMGPDPDSPASIPNAIMAARPRQSFWLLMMALMLRLDPTRPPEVTTGSVVLKHAVDIWRGDPARAQAEVARIAALLDPGLRDSLRPTRALAILPAREWYPLDWTDRIHQLLRRQVLANGPLPPDQVRQLFPASSLVSYGAQPS